MQPKIEHHQMQLEKTHESGLEEWACPSCGRRFLMRWAPFEMKVLKPGDERVQHVGGKGGLLGVGNATSDQASVLHLEDATQAEAWPEAMPGSKLVG